MARKSLSLRRRPGTNTLPEGLLIRDYREEDEAGLLAVLRDLQIYENQFYDRSKPPEAMGPWYIDRLKHDVSETVGRLLVAELDGRIAGYATLLARIEADERDEIPYTFAMVGDLAILEGLRGQGIGEALLMECEKGARAAGQKWLRLDVLAANTSARRFYARMGLEERLLTLEKAL